MPQNNCQETSASDASLHLSSAATVMLDSLVFLGGIILLFLSWAWLAEERRQLNSTTTEPVSLQQNRASPEQKKSSLSSYEH